MEKALIVLMQDERTCSFLTVKLKQVFNMAPFATEKNGAKTSGGVGGFRWTVQHKVLYILIF